MPYITKNTFLNIIKEIDLNKEPTPKKTRLEGKNLTILSKKEMQRLAAISEILTSENIALNRFFLKIKKPVDTLSYIKPERAPSYHLDKNCSALTKEYENYRIPEEIRELGKDAVDKFRKFFYENKEEFQNDKIRFFYKTKKEFNLKRLPEDMVEIKAANSGRGAVQDVDLSSIEKQLDDAIKEAENFKNTDNTHRFSINMYGNKLYGENETENEEEKTILKEWRRLKDILKKKYIFYSMVKHNPDIYLNGSFLDELGLNRCSLCNNDDNEESLIVF